MGLSDRPVKYFGAFVVRGQVVPPRSCRTRLRYANERCSTPLQWSWKKIYASMEEARQSATSSGTEAYACTNCGMFHVGHPRDEQPDG